VDAVRPREWSNDRLRSVKHVGVSPLDLYMAEKLEKSRARSDCN